MMEWRAYWVVALCCGMLGCGKSQDGEFHTYSHDETEAITQTSTDNAQDEQLNDSKVAARRDQTDPVVQADARPSPVKADSLPPTAPAVAEKVENPGAGETVAVNSVKKEPEPLEITVLVPNKDFQTVGPESAVRVSYDDIDLLKVLNMDPVPADCVKYFPEWLKNLDGQRIRLRGFMYPPFQETDLPFFVLARDNAICCFGRDPKRYDVIDVTMRDGETTDYIANRPFDVVGVFHIAPETSQGQLFQLYLIDDAIVIEP